MRDNKLFGSLGEQLASGLLYSEGYDIREMNFRSYFGEIDIICEKDDVIYFVEVKARTTSEFGDPEEAVSRKKKMKIAKTAAFYMHRYGYGKNCEFKVIEILVRETDDDFSVR